MKTLK
jgi:hypothetical protein